MHGNLGILLVLRSFIVRLMLCFSLTLPLMACQTTDTNSEDSQKTALLDSQKAIIRNALNNGKPEMALQSLRALLKLHPQDASLQNLMGLTQLALTNPTRAVFHFREAYKRDHQAATALNLSSAYIEARDFKRAINILKALLNDEGKEAYPYKERIFHNLGYCHLKQENLALAESYFKEALAENPAFFPSHIELARLYEKTNRPALAHTAYRQAADYCLICFEPVHSLSMIYIKSGRTFEARRLLTNYAKTEGVSTEDKEKAARLLRLATIGQNKRRNG